MKVAAIVGPTASGKTAMSIAVAEALGSEIVSLDSMQLYRGMDVGTDKAPAHLRERIPHHLLDVFEPQHDVSVAEFQTLARAAIADISDRGRLPLLVGGSGLYFRAVVDDLRFPPRDERLRASLEDLVTEHGPEVLHSRLSELDPAAAAKIEPRNTRRIVRALEVVELTGRPFSENAQWDRYDSIYELAVAGLRRDREDLYQRVEARVGEMVEAGLFEEVRALQKAGIGTTASQGLGYRQVIEDDTGDAVDIARAIVTATKKFARRQQSWFAADPRIEWFDAAAPDLAEALVSFFRQRLQVPLGA